MEPREAFRFRWSSVGIPSFAGDMSGVDILMPDSVRSDAYANDRTLTAVIEDALRESLKRGSSRTNGWMANIPRESGAFAAQILWVFDVSENLPRRGSARVAGGKRGTSAATGQMHAFSSRPGRGGRTPMHTGFRSHCLPPLPGRNINYLLSGGVAKTAPPPATLWLSLRDKRERATSPASPPESSRSSATATHPASAPSPMLRPRSVRRC